MLEQKQIQFDDEKNTQQSVQGDGVTGGNNSMNDSGNSNEKNEKEDVHPLRNDVFDDIPLGPRKLRAHHRHLPNITRWTRFVVWKWMHLFFPMAIHFLTDKYEDRRHHLIVDTIYAVIVFVLIASNVALGWWFYLYLVPADVDIEVYTPFEIVSGNEIFIDAEYYNQNRDVEDLVLEFYLPEEFVTEAGEQVIAIEQGDVAQSYFGNEEVYGRIFGDVGEEFTVRVVASYTSASRRRYETVVHTFVVTDSNFEVEWDLPNAVTYDVPVSTTIQYTNNTNFDRTDVQLNLAMPGDFVVTAVNEGDIQLAYDPKNPIVTVPFVAAGESGTVQVRGVFSQSVSARDTTIIGDQQQPFTVSVVTTPEGEGVEHIGSLSAGSTTTGVNVVYPRLTVSLTGGDVVNFGETAYTTATVSNVGDEKAENIQLRASVLGLPTSINNVVTIIDGIVVDSTIEGSVLVVNTGRSLAPNEQLQVVFSIPSSIIDGQRLTSRLFVEGLAEIPVLEATIGIPSTSHQTKYNSRINVSAAIMYYGPDGEQLGYGPYSPEPWEITALRVVARVDNKNNPLSDVKVHFTLPGQVDWTNFFSVSAGTALTYNAETHEVEWNIPSLNPSDTGYGTQFEIFLEPNHLQIGLKPHIVQSMDISATDTFTGDRLYQVHGSLSLPVAIVGGDDI